MAEKRTDTAQPFKYIRLKDKGTIFQDIAAGVNITGHRIGKAQPTNRVYKGLRNGLLIEVTAADYLEQEKKKIPVPNKGVTSAARKPVAEKTPEKSGDKK